MKPDFDKIRRAAAELEGAKGTRRVTGHRYGRIYSHAPKEKKTPVDTALRKPAGFLNFAAARCNFFHRDFLNN